MKFKGLIVTVLIFGALGYLGYTYFGKPAEVEFLTTEVSRGNIESAISATGTLNPTISSPVGSQVSGNILELYADYNTPVTKGQLVALIDPEPFEARVEQAKASLESAKTQIISAEVAERRADVDVSNAELNIVNQKAAVQRAEVQARDAKRKLDQQQGLFDEGIASQDALDSAKATYDQAQLSVESAEAQLKTAEANLLAVKAQREVALTQKTSAQAQVTQASANLDNAQIDLRNTQIRSAVDGVVIARNMSPGQTVQASTTAPQLFEIAQDLTHMQVDTNIDESDISRVQVGQIATFTVDAFPNETFQGEVQQIRRAPVNVQNVITYTVVIGVENPDLKLFPGMTANTRIVTDRAQAALRIPSAALRFRPPEALLTESAKQVLARGQGKGKGKGNFDPSQFKGKEGFDPSQFKGKGGFDRSQFQGRGGGRGRNNGDGAAANVQMQTVYTLNEDKLIDAIRVPTGITDGAFVAVLGDGLEEGQLLLTGVENYEDPNADSNNNNNRAPGFPGGGFPGGGGRRGGFRGGF